MPRRVLMPGRFQPFHNGHYYALKSLLEDFDEVVLAIGSAQEGFTCQNPFTAGERLEMIDLLLRSEGLRSRVWLIPVPDLRMPLAWTAHVLSMVPRVEAVASGNPHVLYIYEWAGFKTIKLALHEPFKYNGSRIRRLMLENGDWESLVPSIIAEHVKSLGGVERVRAVCADGVH
ncbi:MAG: nicotinamide-nucleotide adenylyltransferase [Thermosphaera sp.]